MKQLITVPPIRCSKCKRETEANSLSWADDAGTKIRVETWCRLCRCFTEVILVTNLKGQ